MNRLRTQGWANADLLTSFGSITAEGDRTVVLKLLHPDAEMLEALADSHARVLAREVVEQAGILKGPTVGSGPWEVSSFNVDLVRYRANPNYYESGVPFLDGMDIQVIADPLTRITAIRTRFLDVDQADLEDIKEAQAASPALKIARVVEPGAGVAVGFNANRDSLRSSEVRKFLFCQIVLSQAPDESTWDAGGPLSSGLPVPHLDWLLTAPATSQICPQGAVDYTQEYLDSLLPDKLTIKTGEFGDLYLSAAEKMAGALPESIVEIEIQRVTTRVFAEKVWLGGDYEVFVGAQPPVSSVSAYLFSVLHSRGNANTSGLSSPLLDAIIEQQAIELDPRARRDLIREAQIQLMADPHRFMAVTRVSHWVIQPWVHDFSPNLFRGESHWLARVWISVS